MMSFFGKTYFCTCLVGEAALCSWVSQCCSLRLSLPRKLGGSLRRRSQLSMLSQPSPSPSSSASTSTSTTASTSTAPAQTDIDFLDLSDDEESEEMYPFNYYPDEVMPRRRHACCARCTNELQTFDFDDDDSDRRVGLPRLPSTPRACGADRSPGVHQYPQPFRQLPHHP